MTGKLVTPNGIQHSRRDIGSELLKASYLVKPHHASISWSKTEILTAILTPFSPGDGVAKIMKKVANHWNYYLQVGLVYGRRYFTTLLIRSMQ